MQILSVEQGIEICHDEEQTLRLYYAYLWHT